MPRTKKQGIFFGVMMSIFMAYGMEVYNVSIKMGLQSLPGGLSNMTNAVFLDALIEASYMWIFVFIFSNLWGNKIGHYLASKITMPNDNPFFKTLMVSCCTVLIMCPTMSMVATVLFNIILLGSPVNQIFAIFVGTLLKNFPMALLWNLFAAGPLTRLIFQKVMSYRQNRVLNMQTIK